MLLACFRRKNILEIVTENSIAKMSFYCLIAINLKPYVIKKHVPILQIICFFYYNVFLSVNQCHLNSSYFVNIFFY